MVRHRIAAAVLVALLIGACSEDGEQRVSRERTGPPPILISSPAEPPMWPLTVDETDRIMSGVLSRFSPSLGRAYAPIDEACADLEKGPPGGDLIEGHPEVEACLRPYLAGRGVGKEALDLFFESGIAIWSAEQTGPFWLADGFDYDMYGSNGSPPEYLFTPEGVFDVPGQYTNFSPPQGWAPILDATAAATATGPMPEIREAYAKVFGMAAEDIGFWSYGEAIDLTPAREVEGGWAVPFTWELRGCHACGTPIYGRFELDANASGEILGVRYVDACYDPTGVPSDLGAIRERDFGLASCD